MRKRVKKKRGINPLFFLPVILVVLSGIYLYVNTPDLLSDIREETTEITTEPTTETTTESPEAKRERELKEKTESILSNMTLEEKIAQLFFVTPEDLVGENPVTRAGEKTKEALLNRNVGGIIYFTKNITDEEQLRSMVANTREYSLEINPNLPIFTGIDEEGGTVARLGSSPIQVENIPNMSAVENEEEAYSVGAKIGTYLSKFGFNVDFAPVADVITNSQNQIVKLRSFGTDPQRVADMSLKVSEGLNSCGVYSCYKHFPGHGATKEDSHKGLAYSNKTYEELKAKELIPFKNAVDKGADFIMVGHISLPQLTGDSTPATLSPAIVDILRNDLGYEGIAITDSLNMGAITGMYSADIIAVEAIKAGMDMLLMPQDFDLAYNGLLTAVKEGEISEDRINISVKRIIQKKLALK